METSGFPSPANDYIDVGIDLNRELISRPASTFFLRVQGQLMKEEGINNDDLLIVDRSLNPRPGDIIIAILNGSFTLRRLTQKKRVLHLEAANPNHPTINLRQHTNVQIWGVATYSIHKLMNSN